MSVIGPRPIVDDEKERYGNEIYNLLSVRPGITDYKWKEIKFNIR